MPGKLGVRACGKVGRGVRKRWEMKGVEREGKWERVKRRGQGWGREGITIVKSGVRRSVGVGVRTRE